MKKILALLMVTFCVSALYSCACSGNSEKEVQKPAEETLSDETASDFCEVYDSTAVRDSSLRR